jgi:hypothetical protein
MIFQDDTITNHLFNTSKNMEQIGRRMREFGIGAKPSLSKIRQILLKCKMFYLK